MASGADGSFDGLIMGCLIMIGILLAIAMLMVLLFILYKLLRVYALKNLEYRRYFSVKGAFENQEIEIVEELTNHSLIPMFRVDVETHITTKLFMPSVFSGNEINQEFVSRFFVMPFTRIRRHHKIIPKKRGFYRLESAKVMFMGIELYLDSVAELMVYPKELEIEEERRLNQCLLIDRISQRPIMRDPFSFARIRDYNGRDAMNTINHKATARMGRLMVNEREFVLGRRLLIVLNFQAEDSGIPNDIFEEIMEQAMQYASCLAGRALREEWEIGFAANCKCVDGRKSISIPMGAGYAKYMEILEALAGARVVYGTSINRVLEDIIDSGCHYTEIIIFSVYADESMDRRLERLEGQSNMVNIIDLKEVAVSEEAG